MQNAINQCKYIKLFNNINHVSDRYQHLLRNLYYDKWDIIEAAKIFLQLTDAEEMYKSVLECDEGDLQQYPFNDYIDHIEEYIREDLYKTSWELGPWCKAMFPDILKNFKISDITNDDIKELNTLKDIRSKQYKDSLIFYTNYDDKLVAMSYQHKIVFVVDYQRYKDHIYFQKPDRNSKLSKIPDELKEYIIKNDYWIFAQRTYSWYMSNMFDTIKIPSVYID